MKMTRRQSHRKASSSFFSSLNQNIRRYSHNLMMCEMGYYIFGKIIGDILQHFKVCLGLSIFYMGFTNLLSIQGETKIIKMLGNRIDEEKLKDCGEFHLGEKSN